MEPTPDLQVKITTSNDEDWIHLIDSKLSLVRRKPQDLGICRVPDRLREVKPVAYTPKMVSIGPYHRNKPELRAMEEFKWRYTLDFIDGVAETDRGNIQINESHENSPQTLALKKCCKVISELEVEARAFYAEDINLDTYQLVQMFLLDACFILEYMRRIQLSRAIPWAPESLELLVSQLTIIYSLTEDLILLENQIPYNILQQLFDLIPSARRITDASGQVLSLQELAFAFFHAFGNILGNNILPLKKPIQDATFTHLLDMLYQTCSSTSVISPLKMDSRTRIKWGSKSCAAELIKSGFRISLHPRRVSIVDIKFEEGEIFLPRYTHDEFTSCLFRNLIALEQSRNGRQVITSYIFFMRSLLRSEEDFNILERAGTITNFQKSKFITSDFERLGMGVISADFIFRDLCEELNNYKVSWWRWRRVKGYTTVTWFRWKASVKDLKREYFKNRWSFLTFLAASFVILLTVAQTFYTIRAYYPPYH
ncbi:hypothetical protein DCAR_0415320 [Daucus carota subsp. sativus]|uniref:Uncharacterized protein n=2 Tax=Daucus carota subsp. sativus TaxID=79200 RepID=A0AAF0WTY0_DAUCS|nr:hypothetical protein DCAR_0415320 [Daucus carota subsp. sativus]